VSSGPGRSKRVVATRFVEAVALHAAQAVGGQRRFKLEDARRAAGAQQLVDFGVVEVGCSRSMVTP